MRKDCGKAFRIHHTIGSARPIWMIALLALLAVSPGCAEFKEFTQPIAESLKTEPSEPSQPTWEEIRLAVDSTRDVDTTYVRLKRAFGYKTLDELYPPGHTQREWVQLDAGYHHHVSQGVRYSMRQTLVIDGHEGIVQMDVDKEGDGSRVSILYYTRDGDFGFPDGRDFQGLVRTQVEEALL